MSVYIVQAKHRDWPISNESGIPVDPSTLPLSDRLKAALSDWAEFFDLEIADSTNLSPEHAEEFDSQGLRLARRLRQELPGRTIFLTDLRGHRTLIEKRPPVG